MFKGARGDPSVSGRLSLAIRQAGWQQPWATRFLAIFAVALGSGCAVGPDFMRPSAPDVSGYERGRSPATTASANVAGGEAQRLVSGRDIPGEWWRLFRSQPLKTLIAD